MGPERHSAVEMGVVAEHVIPRLGWAGLGVVERCPRQDVLGLAVGWPLGHGGGWADARVH